MPPMMTSSARLVRWTLRRSFFDAFFGGMRGPITSDHSGPIVNITAGWRKSQ